MKSFLFFISFLFISLASAGTTSQIINTDSKKEVVIDASAQKLIKSWNSLFEVYSVKDFAPTIVDLFKGLKDELPMAVIGDFNGDNQKDLALLGHDKKNEITLVLLADGKSYKLSVIRTTKYKSPKSVSIPLEEGEETGLNFYLGLDKDLKSPDQKVSTRLDGLQLENYGGLTQVFYFNRTGVLKEFKGSVE